MWIAWAIGSAFATTWAVGAGKDFETLSDAVDGAASGDELLVDAGRWEESIDLDGKDLDIRGVDGADSTTIAPDAGEVAVTYGQGEAGTLEGFTIEGDGARCVSIVGGAPSLVDLVLSGCGTASTDGGAIRIDGGDPSLEQVVIDAAVGNRGGGIWIGGEALVTVDDVSILDPIASWGAGAYVTDGSIAGEAWSVERADVAFGGGGLYLDDASVDLVSLDVTDTSGDQTSGGAVYVAGGSELIVDEGALSGGSNVSGDGGALYVDASSEVTLQDVVISDNTADEGGAIEVVGGTVSLTGVTFDGNVARQAGGAMHGASGASVDLVDCTFLDNEAVLGGVAALVGSARLTDEGSDFTSNVAAEDGGAVYADGAVLLTFEESTFERNEAGDNGGAVYAISVSGGVTLSSVDVDDNRADTGDGGGVWIGSDVALTLQDTVLTRNVADGKGGAVAASPVSDPGDLSLERVEMRDNQAGRGGGGAWFDHTATVQIIDSAVVDNTTDGDGGGLLLEDAEGAEVLRTWFHGNEADDRGGAVHEEDTSTGSGYRSCSFTENEAERGGGIALLDAAEAELVNDTFVGNAASVEGGHVHVEGGTVRLVNVILALSTDGGGVWGDATAEAGSDRFYTLVFGNAGGHWVGSFGSAPSSSGNLADDDPLFRALSLDGNRSNDDLRLDIGSPAIDAGDPSLFDVDDSVSDIGAWGGPDGFRIDDDGDGFFAHADCDDNDAQTFPGATEIPYDGRDQDCDGEDPTDLDGDGVDGGPNGTDCNDDDPLSYPGAPEVWYDGIDQDCGDDDDYDQDGDGFALLAKGGTDCDDLDIRVFPGAPETWYDGVDQDCSGGSDFDQDFDGHDALAFGGDDCNDVDDRVFAGAVEVCDRIDNDCNLQVDEGAVDADEFWLDVDGDGFGDPTSWTAGCFPDAGIADNGEDCDDTRADVNPDAIETWYDGVDDDCDGRDDDRDGDGYGVMLDCDDLRPEAFPGAMEIRNDLDDDCDGLAETADRDLDGLSDWDEAQIGTDPDRADSDGDTVVDGLEVPVPATGGPDTDGDGRIDPLDDDDDGDFVPTAMEANVDVDGDGMADRDVDRDGIPNRLDADSDGDGWSDADEGTADRDLDGVPDFADFQGPLVGGGCVGGGAASAGLLTPLWLLLAAMRRRRVWLGLLVPGVAGAQESDGLDAHAFDVPSVTGDPRGGWRLVEGGSTRGAWVGGLTVDLAQRPLVERLPTQDQALLTSLTTASVLVSGALVPMVRVDATVPIHVLGTGVQGSFTALGDVRLGAAWSIRRRTGTGVGASLLGTAWLPTGAEQRYVGAPMPAGGAGIALSQRIGAFGWSLNAGVRLAPVSDRRGQGIGPGYVGGLGVHLAVREQLAVVAELAVDGTSGLALSAFPLESSLAVRHQGAKGRWWTLSAGAGLTDVPGVPAWRVALGAGLGRPAETVLIVADAPDPDPEPQVVPVVPRTVEVRIERTEAPILAELIDDRIVVYEQVFFHEGSARILPRSEAVLKAVASVLIDNADIEYLLVEGHTNHRGGQAVNLTLSERRAAAVGRWLESFGGIAPTRLLTKGYGFGRPLLPESDPAAAVVNRRVEFVVVRPDEDPDDAVVPAVVELD